MSLSSKSLQRSLTSKTHHSKRTAPPCSFGNDCNYWLPVSPLLQTLNVQTWVEESPLYPQTIAKQCLLQIQRTTIKLNLFVQIFWETFTNSPEDYQFFRRYLHKFLKSFLYSHNQCDYLQQFIIVYTNILLLYIKK